MTRPGRVHLAMLAGIVGLVTLGTGGALAAVVAGGAIRAERGAGSPVAAADGWMVALGYGQAAPGGYLCPDQLDALRRQADQVRRTVDRHDRGAVVRVIGRDWSARVDGDRAEVTAEVYLRWTAPGESVSYAGTPHRWTFHVERHSGLRAGWKLCRVDVPDLCGTHLRCD